MANHIVILLVLLACLFVSVEAVPQPSTLYPHIVSLDITNILLYDIAVKGMANGNPNDDEVLAFLAKIFNRFGLSMAKFDIPPVIKTLKSKLKRMFITMKKCRGAGGNSLERQLEKWKSDGKYSLQLPHKSGSPTKRKLQHDLETETRKRQELEHDVANFANELDHSKSQNQELKRQFDRLKNPQKRAQGQRGKGKGKLTYKKSQYYKNRQQVLTNLKSTVNETTEGSDIKPVRLTVRDGNGKLVTISFQDDISDDAVTQEEIDEMLFILDTFNIPVKDYHEMAQRFSSLPRLGRLQQRKSDLNESCPLEDINVEYLKLHGPIFQNLVLYFI